MAYGIVYFPGQAVALLHLGHLGRCSGVLLQLDIGYGQFFVEPHDPFRLIHLIAEGHHQKNNEHDDIDQPQGI